MRSWRLIRLWLSDTGSRLGFQMIEFLLPLAAVVACHATPTEVGLVTAVQFLPVLLFSLSAGSFAARHGPVRLLLAGNGARLLAAGYLTVRAVVSGLTLPDLLIAGFIVGTATILYDVVFQATIPRVVDHQELLPVNGLLQASVAAVQMLGPALAGVLVGWVHPAGSFLVCSTLFGLAAFGFAMRLPLRGDGSQAPPVSVLAGLRYTLRERYIRAICLQSGLFNLHEQAFLTVFLIYGLRGAGLSGTQIGIAIGAASMGALLGALAAGWLSQRLHFGLLLSLALPVSGLALLAASVSPATVPLLAFGPAFAVNGVAQGLFNVNAVSLRQLRPPAEFLGPVTAAYRMVSFGTIPLGALLGGFLISHLGGRNALITIAASVSALTLQLLLTPVRRIRSIDRLRPAAASG